MVIAKPETKNKAKVENGVERSEERSNCLLVIILPKVCKHTEIREIVNTRDVLFKQNTILSVALLGKYTISLPNLTNNQA